MIRYTVIVCFIYLFSYSCSGQTSKCYISFRNVLNEASYWFYEQNFDSSLTYFQIAEEYNIPFFPIEAHLYSRTLWEKGQNNKSIEILKKWGRSDFFNNDTTYYFGLPQNERINILKSLSDFNMELSNNTLLLIDRLGRWDQVYRKAVRTTTHKDSIEIYNRLIKYQDSVNFFILIKEIETNGYPDGYVFSGVKLSAVLLHANPSLFLKYYKILYNEIENGRMNLYDFARAIDRAVTTPESHNFKPYNAYFSLNEQEIYSAELVFINRCNIGMSPYFDEQGPRMYRRGATPNKSKLYEYYKSKKEDFNCIKIR